MRNPNSMQLRSIDAGSAAVCALRMSTLHFGDLCLGGVSGCGLSVQGSTVRVLAGETPVLVTGHWSLVIGSYHVVKGNTALLLDKHGMAREG